MEWIISEIMAVAILIVGITVIAFGTHKKRENGKFPVLNALIVFVFCSAMTLFFPLYWHKLDSDVLKVLKTFLMSVHNTIRLFVLDGDFADVLEISAENSVKSIYELIAAGLFLVAPILTFGFILSFFKDVRARIKLRLLASRNIYAFSELNVASVTLAEDIRKSDKSCILLFTDVYGDEAEDYRELLNRVERMKALTLRDDITEIKFDKRSRKSKVTVFLIGQSDDENVMQYRTLFEKYKEREETNLYLFSMSAQSEFALAEKAKDDKEKEDDKKAEDEVKIKVRRVDEANSLVYNYLYNNSGELFESAYAVKDGKKVISVLIVGLGKYGTTFLKTLAWFCQMDGYSLKINAFDADPLAESKFRAQCPELMDESNKGLHDITVHPGVNISTTTFSELVSKITDASFAVTCLGTDEDNIKCALSLRVIFERMKIKPKIKAIVHNTVESASEGIGNFRGKKYDIDFIGHIKTLYSKDVLLNSELESDGLKIHKKYGANERIFWRYEYNYRSSCASAIHSKARIACGIPGAGKEESELTDKEKLIIAHLEHMRWNAYMRSEGYIYSGSKEKASRNDLGKMHHNILSYEELNDEDKRKDINVGTK